MPLLDTCPSLKFILAAKTTDPNKDLDTSLTAHLQHTHRWLFFDNFFTSLPLMESLLENGLYACGTVRTSRIGFPKDLQKPGDIRNRGDMKILQKGQTNLTASVWKDKRLVHHLSTLSSPNNIQDAQRRVNGHVVNVRQPHSVHAYNKFMGGVDLHDQLRAKYAVGRNGKKWWRYIFWFIVNCCIVNAGILYQKVSQRPTRRKRFTHLDFRQELVRELIGGFAKRKRTQPDITTGLVAQENLGVHVSLRMPGAGTTCKYHRRVHRVRRDTQYGCAVCNVHLCKECHAPFHNL